MKNLNAEFLSDLTKNLIDDYFLKVGTYKKLEASFQDEHQAALMQLDNAREESNAAVSAAKKAMAADAKTVPYSKAKKIIYNGFAVIKKWSGWFIVEGFVEIMKELGLFDAAVDEGVINVETRVDGKLAPEFLRKNSIADKFRSVEDGKELSPAVTCPKPIAAFGEALK